MKRDNMADTLREAIRRSGLTIYRIGNATGIHPSTVSRFVDGRISLSLDRADLLAKCVGLRLLPDPDASPLEPTPPSRARPTLAKYARPVGK